MKQKNLADLARTILNDPSIKVTFGGDTSYFSPDIDKNGKKTITINIAKIDATPEGITVMCGLIFHEIGHIHTDGGKPAGMLGEMMNIIEDVRTELLTIKARPGAAFDLEAVTNHCHAKGSFEPQDLAQAIMGKTMAYGRGRVLSQTAILPLEDVCNEMMDDAFGQSFIDDVENILKGYSTLKNTADTTKMSQELIDLLVQAQQQAQQQQQQQQQQGGSGSGQGQSQQQGQDQSGQGEDQEDDDQSDSQDQDDSQGQSKGGDQDDQDADSDSGNGQTDSQSDQNGEPSTGSGSNGSADDDDSDPQDSQASIGSGAGGIGKFPTDEELAEMLQSQTGYGDISQLMQDELAALSTESYRNGDTETPEWPTIGRLTRNRIPLDEAASMVASSRMRARMGSLLFAAKRLPVSNGTSGRKLNTSRLVRMMATGDPKIFSKKVEEAAPNSAVVVVMDTSGSMGHDNRYIVANNAAFALNTCLNSLNGVKCATIEFSNKDRNDGSYSDVNLVCDFGEKPKSERFNILPFSGTPTDQAIWAARGMLLSRPEPRKIILLLTDGEPNDWETTEGATAKTEKDGIEIAAIGIQCESVKHFWKNYRVIYSMDDLPTAMFGMMEALLTRRPGGAI